MTFPFLLVCDLLEQAHRQSKLGNAAIDQCVTNWFKQHRRRIDDSATSASALLSTLLPEKRTDRVYNIQADSLCSIVGRILRLNQSRTQELRRYKKAGLGLDLADCIEGSIKETPCPCYDPRSPVTIEEIDATLHSIAARCRFSSPAVQASQAHPSNNDRDELLRWLYLRMSAREAKWLTRLILKNFQPVILDPGRVYYCYDPSLPRILRIQDNFTAALSLLQKLKDDPSLRDETGSKRREGLLKHLTPVLGVKVGRQSWLKGRSIKHCMNMGHGRMSCEKKVDGEYCQVHIDLSKGHNCIQIFSKSGKDSTSDRAGLHGAIRDSLNIGKLKCKLNKGCILEGELVVYSDKENKILPFHKIRKYVSRSGSFLHTEADSQRHHYEHLMIIYYDVLLINDESLLGVRHSERFKRLTDLVDCREGHAELVERQVICLDQPLAASHLRKAFARSIALRDEGLVLKPDDPYFDFSQNRRAFSGCPIKLKKEYIGSFGDVGDFAVVAARYDADKAKCYEIPNLQWTHFYLGCLDNKEDVQRYQAAPKFTLVHQVELNKEMLRTVVTYGRPAPVPFEDNDTLILDIAPGIAQQKMPTVVFTEPLVFDVRCFSFDKEGNTGFWQPRFPQVSKVHFDRSFLDTISFTDLQKVAEDATTTPIMEDSQEMLTWIAALEGADPRGIPVDATSQSTTTSLMTPSRTSSVRPSTSPAPSPRSPLMPRRSLPSLLEMPETPPLTPPASSDPAATAIEPAKQPINNIATESSGTCKRTHENLSATPRQSKRPRVCSEPCVEKQKPTGQQARQPLGELSVNQATPSPLASQQSASRKQVEAVAAPLESTSIAPTMPEQQITDTSSSAEAATADLTITSPPQPAPATRTCEYAGTHCILANRTAALLSPCIANQLWITENLLPSHGIHQWTADLQAWAEIPRKHGARKICFVEHNRKESTRTFLRAVEQNPQYSASGKREWIEVYDWRLLEDVTALERVLRGSGSSSSVKRPDPKRKWFVGLV
ncbi:ATP dependent dna ligase domain protein [Colletotrichum karsti]|uniref:ATP dependent dna ligase domain protein n=1 Tax=Colletotrichum karsti TaxID=1095194 RepID=A0A9P6IDW2_9PEZI|nr:ATP dependent dna ligase domain protein [Colletotrichum karsti]KAF9881059.1 ATP dependent dna ligase domain protein [Colletotrichum karsti]